jgi:hypothetical protein
MSHSLLPAISPSRKHKVGIAAYLIFLALPPPLLTGTFTAFRSKNYIRGMGDSVTDTKSFTTLNCCTISNHIAIWTRKGSQRATDPYNP